MIRTCVESPLLAKPHSRATPFLDPMERPISIGDNCKKTLDIESLNRPEVPKTQILILKQVTRTESDMDRARRETSNENAMKQYEAAEEKLIN